MQATWKAPVVEDEEGEGGARPQGSKKPSHQSTNATGERSPERREHSSWMWTAFKCRTYLFKCKCRGCITASRCCMSRSDMWSNGFSFFLEVLDIKREFEDEDYSCRRSRHLHKSASVFIILTCLWCFCRFNLSAFGKTLSELVFLTRERIETRYVLLFFWGVLCQSSLWKETKVRCGEWRNI